MAVTSPVPETEATEELEELQVKVMPSTLSPPEVRALAESCRVRPRVRKGVAVVGVSCTVATLGGLVVLSPPQAASTRAKRAARHERCMAGSGLKGSLSEGTSWDRRGFPVAFVRLA
jgi:hypothetical protein